MTRRSSIAVTGLIAIAFFIAFFLATPAHAAGLLIADDGGLLSIEEHTVHVTVNNGIAVTQVTQVFRNQENRVVEGLYSFPVPARASVAGFSMWIDGQEMIGEVLEKQAAREIYNTYKSQKQDPGLLEQSDYRTFDLRVFPIKPLAVQKIQITYYQELESDDDWMTYVYPLASNARQVVNSRVSGLFSLTIDVKSAEPIAEMKSPSHGADLQVTRYSDNYSRASLRALGASLNRDVVIATRGSRAPTGASLIANKEADADGYFSLSLRAGDDLKERNSSADYVFLLDVSASMRDEEKLDQSRQTLAALVDALADDDRFDVIAFNNRQTTAFGSLVAADAAHRSDGAKFLASRQARGGTDFNAALSAAYRYAKDSRALNIVLISDGLSEQSRLASLMRLIASRPKQSRILCVGIGNDVDRALLQRMADETGGLAAFISADGDFQRQAAALHRKLHRPTISNASVEIDGVSVRDVEPAVLGNLFDGTPARIFGRYREGGVANVKLKGIVGGEPFAQTFQVNFPQSDAENPQIQRMWALRRIDRLLNGRGASAADIDQIIRLGQQYSIATEYTSFIVLANDAEYTKWKIDQHNAVRLTSDRDAQTKVDLQLRQLRDKAPNGRGDPSLGPAVTTHAGPSPSPATPSMQSLTSANPNGLPHYGGAFDPVTVGLVAGLCGAAVRRRRRLSSEDPASKNSPKLE
ncbi:MAG TPA: VIT and VWA domain-containing protein [Humisphaera sp.]|nr:VIT and VWA domain-containing protein [Humisphaera sp.]